MGTGYILDVPYCGQGQGQVSVVSEFSKRSVRTTHEDLLGDRVGGEQQAVATQNIVIPE